MRAGDRRWLAIVEGRAADYHGEAVNPKFLSMAEIALGYAKRYQKKTGAGAAPRRSYDASGDRQFVWILC